MRAQARDAASTSAGRIAYSLSTSSSSFSATCTSLEGIRRLQCSTSGPSHQHHLIVIISTFINFAIVAIMAVLLPYLALFGRAPEPGAVRSPAADQPDAWLVAVMGPLTDMSMTLNLPAGVTSMNLFRLSRCWSLAVPAHGRPGEPPSLVRRVWRYRHPFFRG